MNEHRFYVYVYFRPNGSPCYIGKGEGQRWLSHLKKAQNPRLRTIIERAGGDVPHFIFRDSLTESEAFATEITFIKAIGRGRHGPLVNFTDGGDGTTGREYSAETRLKISKANSGRKMDDGFCQRRREYMLTYRHSAESKAKIGAAHKGRVYSETSRRKMSETRKGKILTPEHIAKVTKTIRRVACNKSPEHKAKLAEMCRKRNAERAARMRAARDGVAL